MTSCVFGKYCNRHEFVHGAEAEELREELEKFAANNNNDADAIYWARRVLDGVDARDSVAYVEVKGFINR